MVQCHRSGTVSVFVADKALPEYEIKKSSVGNVKTYECYIEARAGDDYEVRLDGFPMVNRGYFDAELSVDGTLADAIVDCAPERGWKGKKHCVYFTGFKADKPNGQVVITAFQFEDIEITDDSSKYLTAEELKDICTIRVRIIQTMRVGHRLHEKVTLGQGEVEADDGEEEEEEAHALPIVQEDSQPAKFGLSTG